MENAAGMTGALRGAACATLVVGLLAFLLVRHERARARVALRAAGDALAVTGHELRTPLHAMMTMVDLARGGELTAEQRVLLTRVRESGEALARLLDDLLDQAGLYAGRVSVAPSAVEPRVLFDSVLELFAPQAHAKGLRLRQCVSADVPAVLRTDGDRVRQILVNLIGNAIKFTEAGTISLTASASPRVSGQSVLTIMVTDTGSGIAADVRPHLFEPYAASGREVGQGRAGLGLGLAIARRLAILLDGELTLTSAAGAGTTATVRLRCPVVVAQGARASLAGQAVVVEHPDPAVADALRAYAATAGMRVVAHDSAQRAVWLTATPCGNGARRVELHEHAGPEGGTPTRLDCDPLTWRGFVAACEAACRAPSTADAGPPAGRRDASGDSFRVLVVDDHALSREALRRQLEQLGHRVVACGSGREALAVLESGTAIDVVVTDWCMPRMGGAALSAAVRAHARPERRALPVVAVTALAMDATAAVGVAACLRKPIGTDTLRGTLETVMRAARASGERDAASAAPRFDPAALDHETLLHAFCASSCFDAAALDILALCRRSLTDDRDALERALQASERTALLRWRHRAGGTFALFRQPHVDRLIDRLGASAASGDAAMIRAAGIEVLRLIDHLIAHVEQRAGNVTPADGPAEGQQKGDGA
ncbi:response regulator [Burkholderia anthina]|uniref:ATP-binding protein n=1 Tax=Burkholderia anthina TaxID=179879 RepID=UPI001CF354F4|nr:ATP-binding protein [Burkholderia anthina]MCA8089371.1 response regulator [Burkholderia anthina]